MSEVIIESMMNDINKKRVLQPTDADCNICGGDLEDDGDTGVVCATCVLDDDAEDNSYWL